MLRLEYLSRLGQINTFKESEDYKAFSEMYPG